MRALAFDLGTKTSTISKIIVDKGWGGRREGDEFSLNVQGKASHRRTFGKKTMRRRHCRPTENTA